MRFGINLMLFDGTIGDAVLDRFAQIRQLGYEVIEVPVFDPPGIPVARIRKLVDELGLTVTTSGALPPGLRFYGPDAGIVERAQAYLCGVIDTARALGAEILCGPLYKTVGDNDTSIPLDDQRDQVAENLQPVASHAENAGVTLALEPLNRFETNLVNTTAQGVAICHAIDSPSAQLLLDTFHMHIEEKDSARAIRSAIDNDLLAHFHASESDRGTVGKGQVHWDPVASALGAAEYDGLIVLESFSDRVEAIRTAVSCWRPFYDSPEQFMREGLAFARGIFR